MLYRSRVRAAAIAAAIAAAGVLPGASTSLKDWANGPVRYIMTDYEVRAWKSLRSDGERSVFIERFWTRRDPTPETLANEYRQLFWERVKEANSLFLDSPRPGWMTDRGKIHVLYGAPTEIQDDPNAHTEGLDGASRGLIRWIYEGRPAANKTLDAIVVVPFVRDLSGEYRLSQDPRLTSVFLNVDDLKDKESTFWQSWYATHMTGGRTELGALLDQGTLQAVPSQEEFLIERVETMETYATRDLAASVARYRSPLSDGSTLVVLTVSIPSEEYSVVPALVARIVPRDATRSPKVLGEASFRAEGAGAERVAQARVRLDPGTWSLTLMAADPEGKSNGLRRVPIEIPAEGPDLRTSDVILARTIEPVPYASLASYDEPYIVGSFRVVPRAANEIVRGDTITLFYEIYGGREPYRVAYGLEGREDDGRFTPLGNPDVREGAEAVQGWSFPTGPRWPAGEYRVRVEIADAAGARAESVVPFVLVEETSP